MKYDPIHLRVVFYVALKTNQILDMHINYVLHNINVKLKKMLKVEENMTKSFPIESKRISSSNENIPRFVCCIM